MAAHGEPLPPKDRSGLLLFLRRGMWGWAQTLVAASSAQEPAHAPPLMRRVCDQRAAVVHLLATMAISPLDRRTP
jgi:hypothetical protein